jgi:predicted phosphodiesterase
MQIKILAMSDLHNELEPFHAPREIEPDLIVLAGDIATGDACVSLPRIWFPGNCPKIVVCGNHEFYRSHYDEVIYLCRKTATREGSVYFLEQDEIVLPIRDQNVRILGCILWTDFAVNGAPLRPFFMAAAAMRMNDFRLIGFRGHIFTPEDSVGLHEKSVAWLEERLSIAHDGPTIVVTHHAPSNRSQPPQFVGGELAPAFASNLEALILQYQPELWIHGHTHFSVDYTIGRTRVYSNQRGYPGEECGFTTDLIAV